MTQVTQVMQMKQVIGFSLVLLGAAPAAAQSLYVPDGDRAVEVSAGWSVGPSSNGLETHVGVSLDGRWDVGLGVNRYNVNFDDGSDSTFTEYAPFARYFIVKEQGGGAPVSVSVNAQVFVDDYPSAGDKGAFVQAGATVYKGLKLSDRFELQPFAGFAFVAESYTFGGGDADTAQYLTRDFGLHFTTATSGDSIGRLTLIEQSFRRETYRGLRIAFIKRL